MVACTDGSVYVWQLASLHLDSTATGQVAQNILASCDPVETVDIDQTTPTEMFEMSQQDLAGANGKVLRTLIA